MRIILTILIIGTGLMAEARMPKVDQAAAPAPYKATIIPAAFHLFGDVDCAPVWDV